MNFFRAATVLTIFTALSSAALASPADLNGKKWSLVASEESRGSCSAGLMVHFKADAKTELQAQVQESKDPACGKIEAEDARIYDLAVKRGLMGGLQMQGSSNDTDGRWDIEIKTYPHIGEKIVKEVTPWGEVSKYVLESKKVIHQLGPANTGCMRVWAGYEYDALAETCVKRIESGCISPFQFETKLECEKAYNL